MTKTLKELIVEIIDDNAQIHNEYGEYLYIDNTEDLADLILKALEEKL